MRKLYRLASEYDPEQEEYVFPCPGCGYGHSFIVKWGPKSLAAREKRLKHVSGKPAPVWTFNGDMERPTFQPSLLYMGGEVTKRCHSFVTDGKIQFLADCDHDLAGKTVEMEDVEDA